MSEYSKIEAFKDIIEAAENQINGEEYKLNLGIKVSFEKELIYKKQFPHYEDLAVDFQRPIRPDSLTLNHGEYITENGIPHVIDQLKCKTAGNRAIISLISQKDILDSSDKPIPSFLILQFSKEQDVLYITTYFKALEVSKFLQINLEEIKIIVRQITDEIHDIKHIHLHIIAFRAYSKKNINPFMRFNLHKNDIMKTLDIMREHPEIFHKDLVQVAEQSSTNIETIGFENIIAILNSDSNKNDFKLFAASNFKDHIEKCIHVLKELKQTRKNASHSDIIAKLEKEYQKNIKKAIEEAATCL